MDLILVPLAIVGAVAILRNLLRTLVRLGIRAAEATSASGLAEVSARRGDLTALAERRAVLREARQRRAGDLVRTLLWLGWLTLPLFLGWVVPAYLIALPLWFVAPPRITPPIHRVGCSARLVNRRGGRSCSGRSPAPERT